MRRPRVRFRFMLRSAVSKRTTTCHGEGVKRRSVRMTVVLSLFQAPLCKGAGVRWTPLPQAEAPTEPAGETLARSA